ncbi:MAG: 4-hydroxy-3-methylbut-2-enyl diphosphate reductase [Armatimonadota bacterium]
MRISIAEHAGFCFGVKRAIRLAEEALSAGRQVTSLGPIIHNPQVVAHLEEMGMCVAEDVAEAHGGDLMVRTHGASPEVYEQAESQGLGLIDATCPFVKRAHNAARGMLDEGYQVIVVGDRDHPETLALVGHLGGKASVVEGPDDVDGLDLTGRVGVVVQTTQRASNLCAVVSRLLPLCPELKVANTICDATAGRQEAAQALALEADVMIVVGGHRSANTRRLAEICRGAGTPTYHIETAAGLQPEWFSGVEHVGLTAGASTPDSAVQEVQAAIEALPEHT